MGTITPIRSHVVRITLVDDERFDHLLLAMASDEAGLHADIRFVEDGDELLRSLSQEDVDTLPDLIVIERNLHGRGALALLDALQADPVNRQIPVVMLGAENSFDAHACRSHGARWVTDKPQSFDDMVEFAESLKLLAMHPRYRDLETLVVETYEALQLFVDLTSPEEMRTLVDGAQAVVDAIHQPAEPLELVRDPIDAEIIDLRERLGGWVIDLTDPPA